MLQWRGAEALAAGCGVRVSRRAVLPLLSTGPFLINRYPAFAQKQKDFRSVVDEVCVRLLERHAVPGATIAYIEDGSVAWTVAKGFADKEVGRLIAPDTPFEAASLAKPAFAYVVLRLCEQGKMTLDTQLGDVLPEATLREEGLRRVKVRHILSHTSGIEADPPKGRSAKILFTPGSRFLYSPHAFDYLQRLVETVTSQPLRNVMQEVLFKPLSMTNSDFDWTASFAERRAAGYDAKGNAGQTINERFWRMSSERRETALSQYPFANFPNAASSLTTTAPDYARFLLSVLRPGGGTQLSTAGVKEMLTSQIPAGPAVNWGLGFGLLSSRTRGLGFWQWGDFAIFQNFAVAFLDSNAGMVSLTNGARGQRVNKSIAELLFQEDLGCFRWLRV